MLLSACSEMQSVYDKLTRVKTAQCLAGFNVNLADEDGDTLLHYAIKDKRGFDAGVVFLLLLAGANINIANGKGETPPSLAISLGYANEFFEVCGNKNLPVSRDLRETTASSMLQGQKKGNSYQVLN